MVCLIRGDTVIFSEQLRPQFQVINLNLNFRFTDDDATKDAANQSNRFFGTQVAQLFCAMLSCCNQQPGVFDRKIWELRGQFQGFRKQFSNASHYKLFEFQRRETCGCLSISALSV